MTYLTIQLERNKRREKVREMERERRERERETLRVPKTSLHRHPKALFQKMPSKYNNKVSS